MEVGIAGYGAYVPRHRIKVEEIARVWGTDAPAYKKGLRLQEKSVPAPDQDTITMSVEAARHALTRAGIDPARLGAVYVGSESHPYAVKPSGTVVAEAVGAVLPVLPYDQEAASWHARERARLGKRGRPPSAADGQIAAIASVNDLTLVTANVKDFRRFKDLVVEDWSR